jgi:uncharacterized protein (DUF58 family)
VTGGAQGSVLDPRALAAVTSLRLRARQVVEGTLGGLHRSPHHGSSLEFADHRDYTQGDEIRHIDWKLLGKLDRLYVKRFEHETNLRAYLLLDCSASMAYGERGMSKLDYARTLLGSLAYLLLEQRDAVGLGLFHDGLDTWVPPRADRAHLQVLLDRLEAVKPQGSGVAARALSDLAERVPRRGLVLLATDGFEPLPELGRALARLRHRHHEVIFLQVLDEDEIEFPFQELTLFQALEGEGSVLSDPARTRRAYLEALAAHGAAIARHCREHEIDHHRFRTGEALDRALLRLLGSRA